MTRTEDPDSILEQGNLKGEISKTNVVKNGDKNQISLLKRKQELEADDSLENTESSQPRKRIVRKVHGRHVPERFRACFRDIKDIYEEQVQAEANWIARILSQEPTKEFTAGIKHVLHCFKVELLEVPYVKDYCNFDSPFSEKDLWTIYDLDRKYYNFLNHRATTQDYLLKHDISGEYVDSMLEQAERVEELVDLTDYITLTFSDKAGVSTQGEKQPVSKSLRQLSGLDAFLSQFGITAQQLGRNFKAGEHLFEHQDSLSEPLTEAAKHIGPAFPTAARVLQGARAVLAQEIGSDPQIRKSMRRDWEMHATVSVQPTKEGESLINEIHPYHPFKRLNRKPLTAFKDGQFLAILMGRKENLLTITIDIPDFASCLLEFYSSTSDTWNKERAEIIELAMKEYLVPLMSHHISKKLQTEAQENIYWASYTSLYNKINVRPYRGPKSQNRTPLPRVVTISSEDENEVYGVFMNQHGQVRAKIQVPDLHSDENRKKMADFIYYNKTNVVGVSKHSVLKHMPKMVDELNRTAEYGEIDLVVVDDEVARFYSISERARREFPRLTHTMRYCISLARRLQNPLIEYLWLGRDLLSIQHNNLQRLVNRKKLLVYLQRALVSVVNDMGVDVNEARKNKYLSGALQYVCALGPNTAAKILNITEIFSSRDDAQRYLREIKLKNCAGYLRIKGTEPLDDTRIHPKDYEKARQLASDALGVESEDPIRDIMKCPENLDVLQLDDPIMELIKKELQDPYSERRKKYETPTVEDVFYMVTGETRQTFGEGEGFIIPARIDSFDTDFAMCGSEDVLMGIEFANCVLENGLTGIIHLVNVADDPPKDIRKVLREHQNVNCKILHIDYESFEVILSCKASDTRRGSDYALRQLPLDPYFNNDAPTTPTRARPIRVIKHPMYKVLNETEAEDYLYRKPRGELVIRPSLRGHNYTVITWKVDQGLHHHIDIMEVKDSNSTAKLKVGDQLYKDLNEVIKTYIWVVADKVEDLMKHPKYFPGSTSVLNDILKRQIEENPYSIAYRICKSENAGYFDLVFMADERSPMGRWGFCVKSGGYQLRCVLYPTIDDMISAFKMIQMTEAWRG